jgi:arylsulfatase A-like enzyme
MGQLDNTIISFFNDNGMGAKGALYEGGALSPAFVWRKNLKGGRRLNQLLANIDFAPTVYELYGMSEQDQPKVDGKSFVSLLNGDDKAINEAVFLQIGSTRAVLSDEFKYIAWRIHPDREKNFDIKGKAKPKPLYHIASTRGGRGLEKKIPKNYKAYWDSDQLYDLRKDRKEQSNLASNPEYAVKLQSLKKLLSEHVKDQPGKFGEF